MHPPEVRAAAKALIEAGISDCEISRRLGIPRTTIRDWRKPRYVSRSRRPICPRCWRPMKPVRFAVDDYVEILGLYLGDGCISQGPRTCRLRLTLDAKYPRIVREARLLLVRFFHRNKVHTVERGDNCVDISVYHAHLPCLIPQHGAGKKHGRDLSLELWQFALVAASPWPFIRGCIRSDGCYFVNRTGPYAYPSYAFNNRSARITALLGFALRAAGISDFRITRNERKGVSHLRVNRRDSVALMEARVGVKE